MPTLEEQILASGKYDTNHRIVGVRAEPCSESEEFQHIIRFKLASDDEINAEDLVDLIDAGGEYWMIPSPHAPAYDAHVATGLPLILQTRECPGCGRRVLFA